MSDTEKSQSERFKKAAREAGADMSKKEFGRVIGKVAKPQVPPQKADTDEDQEPDE